jgi:general secretion pathway protein G
MVMQTTIRRTRRKSEHGFTLLELIVVMMVIGILAAIAAPRFEAALRAAREAALRQDLRVMREAIDGYTADKQKAPESLDDLVTSGYLRELPVDPITRQNSTWVPQTEDTLTSVDQSEPGIDDVHSGSDQQGSDGKSYSEW